MERRDQWVGGAVLITIGVALLLGQYVGDAGRFIVLGIGVVLLVLFAISRNPGALIGGGIMTGLGIGILLTTELEGEAAGSAVVLGLGGGFLGVWLLGLLFRIEETRIWPLIPGAILTVIGLAILLGTEALETVEWVWPALLIGLGVVVIVAAVVRRGPRDQAPRPNESPTSDQPGSGQEPPG
jgi:hypothetical protein